jgi:transketolase C-terminal domain/subunit
MQSVSNCRRLVTFDNHYAIGGQGDLIFKAIANLGINIDIKHGAVQRVPPSGTNSQVLEAVQLDVQSIINLITI